MGPTDRATIVVSDSSEAQQNLALYAKFWLDGRSTGYWTGAKPIPWYLDSLGPRADAAARTGADYLVGESGLEASCPRGRRTLEPGPAGRPPLVILQVPPAGCGAPGTPAGP